MEALFVVIYLFFSILLGWRFVDGRWEALEDPDRKIWKIPIAVILGIVFGSLLIIGFVLRLIFEYIPKWLR